MMSDLQIPVRVLPPAQPAKQCPECRHARYSDGGTYCTVGLDGDEVFVIRGACPRFQRAPE